MGEVSVPKVLATRRLYIRKKTSNYLVFLSNCRAAEDAAARAGLQGAFGSTFHGSCQSQCYKPSWYEAQAGQMQRSPGKVPRRPRGPGGALPFGLPTLTAFWSDKT